MKRTTLNTLPVLLGLPSVTTITTEFLLLQLPASRIRQTGSMVSTHKFTDISDTELGDTRRLGVFICTFIPEYLPTFSLPLRRKSWSRKGEYPKGRGEEGPERKCHWKHQKRPKRVHSTTNSTCKGLEKREVYTTTERLVEYVGFPYVMTTSHSRTESGPSLSSRSDTIFFCRHNSSTVPTSRH